MRSLTPAKPKENGPIAERTGGPAEFPFPVRAMRDEMDKLFDRFFSLWPRNGNGWKWGVEVEDQEENVVVRAEAPGFEPGDFDLQLRENELVLKACRKVETKDKDGKVRELRQQECYESMTIPAGIDKEKVNAKYQNGILTVTLPRSAEGKGKRIPVSGS